MRRRQLLRYGAAALFVLAACTGESEPAVAPTSAAPSTAVSDAAAAACPATYAAPDPDRPTVALHFTLAPTHDRVTGREHVEFTADRPITEVVFRLVPQAPVSRAHGGGLVVTTARVDGVSVPTTTSEPTTLRLPLPSARPPGKRVTADLTFALTLPPAAVDRIGHTDRIAWWGSGHPLLAAVRGRG